MNVSRKLYALLFTCALGLIANPVYAQTKIDVGYTTAADFVPLFVAKDKGFFAKHNIDATLTRIGLASNVPSAIMAGSLQIGMGTAPMLLQAAVGGLNLVAVCGASRFLKTNPMAAILVRPGAKITSAADLRGKKVGVPGLNSMFDVIFRKWLLDHKVPLNQVTYVETPFPRMKDLLKKGTLDAVLAIEPFRTAVIASKAGVQLADFIGDVRGDIIGAFYMAKAGWANKHPQVVHEFRAAYVQAIRYSLAHPAEAKKIEIKYLGVASPTIPTYSVKVSKADLALFASFSRQIGLLHSKVDVSKLVFK